MDQRILIVEDDAELAARIAEFLREQGSVGDVTIDASAREAHVRGVRVDLTSGELDLLFFFASRADEVLSRAVIYQELRGATYDDESDRSIDLMVSRLRFKLSTALDHRDVIKTVRGVGYVFSTKV